MTQPLAPGTTPSRAWVPHAFLLIVAALVAASAMTWSPQAASARPAAEARTVAPAGTAAVAAVPNCVTTQLDDSGGVDVLYVYNNCNSAHRIKVVLAYGPDFPCRTFPAHSSARYQWAWPSRFDGLQSC